MLLIELQTLKHENNNLQKGTGLPNEFLAYFQITKKGLYNINLPQQ